MFIFSTSKKRRQIKSIPLELIIQSKYEVRDYKNDSEIRSLSKNIKDYGVIEPILVKKLENDIFEIISGNRRFLAAKEAKLEKIPAVIVEECDKKLPIFFLSENLHHKKLHFFEEADALFKLINEYNFTREMISNSLGVDQLFVTDRLKLLRLSEKVKEEIRRLNLDIDYAVLISDINSELNQMTIIEEMKDKKLHIDELKNLVRHYEDNNDIKSDDETINNETIYIVKDIRFFDNTISQAIDIMNQSGLDPISMKSESDEFIEYMIRIPKDKIYIKKSSGF